jgi:DNA adenine methylase
MTQALPFEDDTNAWKPPRARSIPSLIKWTGSKRSQAPAILRLLPPYRRYFEPFVGGGAMLFAAAVPGSVAGDIYRPLIELWRLIQSEPGRVVSNYREQWLAVNAELDALDMDNLPPNETLPAYFYKVRERFNRTQDPLDLNFIMRTCVNGIVRFNDKGAFNNSFHLSRRGMEPARFEKVVLTWQSAIKGVDFVCQDYEMTLEQSAKGDFVYLDPPYAGNKQRYAEDLNLERFFTALEGLNRKGVSWALSFDGRRGERNLIHDVPKEIYKRHALLSSGLSAVNKVLNGPVEAVEESLYLNY